MPRYDAEIDLYQLLRTIWSRGISIVLVLGLTLAIAYFAVSRMPRLYESFATMLVEPRSNIYLWPGEAVGEVTGSLVASRLELARAPETFAMVVEELGLAQLPEFNGGKTGDAAFEAALATLSDQVVVAGDRRTAVFYIRARSRDGELAMHIANGVAQAAIARRSQFIVEDARRAIEWLEGELPDLTERVRAAEAAVADYRIDRDMLGATARGSLVDEQMTSLSERIAAASERRIALNARADVLTRMIETGAPIDGLAELARYPTVDGLLRQRSDVQVQLAREASTLLANHPRLAALRARVDEIDQLVVAEGRRIAGDLRRDAGADAGLADALRRDLATLQRSASQGIVDSVDLAALEREAAAGRSLLEQYLTRLDAARSLAATGGVLPDMRIVTHAMEASGTISPRTGLVLAAVAIVAAGAALVWVVVMGLAAAARRRVVA
ncbi:GumC family protein [Devosia nitrariae]|uniref:Polysaccharide chain length determinant N-terminal domain-containing protein n=1 Tax=Devosia nitrariae TaxID=2071872 RepID=A0ABQ5W413_9HYPH|nr:hypothetical protein [Devosia nitrariae]GLQ54800.1 hypothetical protein GCM10010862_20590 [Devosia nitrariae]